MKSQSIEFDPELIEKYNTFGPRYTSYPTAVQFTEAFSEADYRAAVARSNETAQPLSLYFHIPFCDTVCFYCACNKVWTRDRSKTTPYLQRLFQEIERQGALFNRTRPVVQLHWGGGTPTFISHDEMQVLMEMTRTYFNLLDDDSGEYSIEIDPREANADTVRLLRSLGFNRMSLGVQDFNPQVQKSVNRIQSEAETFTVLEAARAEGFKSINVDLIYGLPYQTRESFLETLEKLLAVSPERFSVFNYAHLPDMFPSQRRMEASAMPSAEEKLAILSATIERLTAAGYVYIGMDHFAKPEDELAVAQRAGKLYRNFQGYSTHAECDLVAMGATSISLVNDVYAQNEKTLNDYYARIDAGQLAIFRGVRLNEDDLLRRDVIMKLMSNFELDYAALSKQWGIDFKTYFADALDRLTEMAADGLLCLDEQALTVLPKGRLLIRNIAMVFDAYLSRTSARYSKVI